MDRIGCERSEFLRFCCKNVLFRRYGSFNHLVVLYYLELLTSAKKIQEKTMLFQCKTIYLPLKILSSCTCITITSGALAQVLYQGSPV